MNDVSPRIAGARAEGKTDDGVPRIGVLPPPPPSVSAAAPSPAAGRHVRAALLLVEPAFCALALFVMSGGLSRAFDGAAADGGGDAAGDPITRTLLLAIYLTAALVSVTHLRSVLRAARRAWLAWALVAMAAASVLWSAAPRVTLQRSVALGAATLFGVYVAARFDRRTQLRVFGWALGIAAALSLATALLVPDAGVTAGYHEGAWRGIYGNKNMLGRLCALGATIHLLRAQAAHRRPWGAWAGAALCGVLTLLSRSATAVVVLATLVLLLPLYRTLRWRPSLRLVLLTFAVLAAGALAVLFATESDSMLSLVGRDATLSGRTKLWKVVLWFIEQRPRLGYGYGAFWSSGSATAAAVVNAIRWNAPHAHDNFLDVALDLGLAGLALFVFGILAAARRAVAAYRASADPAELWPLLLLTFLVLFSITDTIVLRQNHLVWVLYVATIALPTPTAAGLPLRPRAGRHAVSIGVRVRHARHALIPDRAPSRS